MPIDQMYIDAAVSRYRKIEAEEQQSRATAASARADENPYTLEAEMENLASIQHRKASLERAYNKYVTENTPPQVAPEREDSYLSKRIEEMTPQDALNMLNETSDMAKLGGKLDFNDPNVQRGWVEMQNRRARGENRS